MHWATVCKTVHPTLWPLSNPVCLSVCNVGVLWPNGWMDQDETWHTGRPRPWPHCVRWGPSSPSPKRGQSPPIFGPFLLWPNAWMPQNATWYGGRPQPRRLCVRWEPSSPSPKRGQSPPPIFGPCLLWPNGWMDHDATCYGGRPLPRWLCVWCAPSSPRKKGHSLHPILAHVYCGQTAGWMKMPLGTEVDLGPDHIVLDGNPAPHPRWKGHSSHPPLFSAHVYCGNGRPSQLLRNSCANCRPKTVYCMALPYCVQFV